MAEAATRERPRVGEAFEAHVAAWDLAPDGEPIATRSARLLPVRWRGRAAMLRIATDPETQGAGAVLAWWDGDGAARVYLSDRDTLLIERAEGAGSLARMAREGDDDAASRILCATAARLHAPRAAPPPHDLAPLACWFEALEPVAAAHGGVLAQSLAAVRGLLAEPREVGVLHGDLHHDNVLDFGDRSWLAIDPTRLVGERGFDFANIFTNPDLADPSRPVATEPGRFARRLEVVCAAARLERRRQLRWILAWCGLSAAWFIGDGDGDMAAIDLAVATLAAAEIDR